MLIFARMGVMECKKDNHFINHTQILLHFSIFATKNLYQVGKRDARQPKENFFTRTRPFPNETKKHQIHDAQKFENSPSNCVA